MIIRLPKAKAVFNSEDLKAGKEKLKSYSVFLTIFFTSINTFSATICNKLGVNAHIVTVSLVAVIFGSLYIFAILSLLRMNKKMYLYLFVLFGLYLFSIILYPENRIYLTSTTIGMYFWLRGIPTLVVCANIEDKKIMYEVLYKLSFFIVFFQAFISAVAHLGYRWYDRSNYMEISYQLLLPVALYIFKNERRLIDWISLFVGAFIIVFEGGRWAVAGVGVCIIYKIITNLRDNKYKILFTIMTMVITVALINFDNLMDSFLSFADTHNLKGHFVRTLRANEMLESVERWDHYRLAVEMIGRNPIIGYGLGGDRYYINGSYIHNIILEVVFDYGVVAGISLLIYYFISIIKLLREKDYYLKVIVLSLIFSMGLFKLILSSSYLEEASFFALIGMALNDKIGLGRLNFNE